MLKWHNVFLILRMSLPEVFYNDLKMEKYYDFRLQKIHYAIVIALFVSRKKTTTRVRTNSVRNYLFLFLLLLYFLLVFSSLYFLL